jgi:Ca2+-binding RTX toxin-like protein
MPIAVTSIEVITTNEAGVALNGGSTVVGQSPDGTKILFLSGATNAAAGDTNGFTDLYLKDLTTGVITRLSFTDLGAQLNDNVSAARFSLDGTKVLFETLATNVVSGDTNAASDVFVIDLGTGAITRLGVNELGVEANGTVFRANFSADGSQVVFSSRATNLSPGDADTGVDVYVQDLDTGLITLVSTSASGVKGNGVSGAQGASVFSPDGTLVAFTSTATNLVPGDTNGVYDIFIKNLVTGAITRANVSAAGIEANGAFFDPGSFSPDGTKLLIRADSADNLVPGAGTGNIFVKDLVTGELTLVTADADGVQGNSFSYPGGFSPDGRYVVFQSNASNLVPGDTNGQQDIFIKDLLTGSVTRVSAAPDGTQANGYNATPRFSPDGLSVIFWTFAPNLAANVDTTRGSWVVVRIAHLATEGVDALSGTAAGETIDGLGGDDVIDGLDGDDTLDGGAGNDELIGGDGADYLRGGDGADILRGGAGDDTYVVDSAGDIADETGGDGTDLVWSRVSWTLGAGLENLTLGAGGLATDGFGNSLNNVITGNASDNVLIGFSGDDTLTGNGGRDELQGDSGDDALDGGQGNDLLYGGSDNDVLDGGIGNDYLNGGAGADTMSGGAGNDTYHVDDAGDVVIEVEAGSAGGAQDLVYSSVNFTLGANIENLNFVGSTGLIGVGNGLRNNMTGADGADVLHGGGDVDTLTGAMGDDMLFGEAGNDIINGGGDGDWIEGGAGSDRLTGDTGADRFVFSNADISGGAVETDQVVDLSFADGDVIDLSAIDANTILDGDQAFFWAANNRFTKVAGQAILTYANGVTTLQLDVNGDGKADFKVGITGDHGGTAGNLWDGDPSDTDGGWFL